MTRDDALTWLAQQVGSVPSDTVSLCCSDDGATRCSPHDISGTGYASGHWFTRREWAERRYAVMIDWGECHNIYGRSRQAREQFRLAGEFAKAEGL